MQPVQISLNPDLKQLEDEGFDLEICGAYLLVHHIPYVTPVREVKYGTFVCILTLATPTRIGPPSDHTIYFIGDTPCTTDGMAYKAIINNSNTVQLTEKIRANHYFSSKPKCGYYKDHYEKISTYARILTAEAKAIDPFVTCRPKHNKAA